MKAKLRRAYSKARRLFTAVQAVGEAPINLNSPDLNYFVDRFSIFQSTVRLSGWAICRSTSIRKAFLLLPCGKRIPLTSYGLKSDDLVESFGIKGRRARF